LSALGFHQVEVVDSDLGKSVDATVLAASTLFFCWAESLAVEGVARQALSPARAGAAMRRLTSEGAWRSPEGVGELAQGEGRRSHCR
jgi:hypothetical protein